MCLYSLEHTILQILCDMNKMHSNTISLLLIDLNEHLDCGLHVNNNNKEKTRIRHTNTKYPSPKKIKWHQIWIWNLSIRFIFCCCLFLYMIFFFFFFILLKNQKKTVCKPSKIDLSLVKHHSHTHMYTNYTIRTWLGLFFSVIA